MDKGILEQRYFSKLLEYFPIGKYEEDFYNIIDIDEHFEGWDEEWWDLGEEYVKHNKHCYKQSVKAIKDKTWDQVVLYNLPRDYDDVFDFPLTRAGMLYYLPAFLHNYYNQVDSLGWKSYIIAYLSNGYEYFEENLTREQSKMVAIFLVNEANLFDDPDAQQALTSYWGYFLLS